jgi:hypothetical protein
MNIISGKIGHDFNECVGWKFSDGSSVMILKSYDGVITIDSYGMYPTRLRGCQMAYST